jgi:hypothetical protein
MAQVLERCPHCGHRGADILRSERRPGACVLYLSCRACSGDWLSAEDINDEVLATQTPGDSHYPGSGFWGQIDAERRKK